jgi:nucleoside-diphosphate-sugar epimerase
MKSIFITGSSGFVGKNLIKYFNSEYKFYRFSKNQEINLKQDVVLHLAGKAHDLKNTLNIEEYYIVNTELTKHVFDNFLKSEAKVFITLSSVKAVSDISDCALTEDYLPNPKTHYGKSKLLAEQYILSKNIPKNKRVYILRPCMIHGPGNKGNLNLLYKIVSNGFFWPLGAYENKRSLCSIDNLCFIINELIQNHNIPSGIYNLADDESISTKQILKIISRIINRNFLFLNIPKFFINLISYFGDFFKLPINKENLKKLTTNYIVSNEKIIKAINKKLPVTTEEGLKKTIHFFIQNNYQ